jgi:hypothetical protein
MNTVAMVAAPAAAGLTVAWLGHSTPLLIDGATFLVLAAAGLAIRASRHAVRAQNGEPSTSFSLRSDTLLWPLILGLCVFVLAGEVTNVARSFCSAARSARARLHSASSARSLQPASSPARWVAGRTTSDANRALRAAVVATILALALLTAGLAPTLWVFAAAWRVLGLTNGVLNTDVSTLVLSRTPESARGRVLANVNAMARGSALGAMTLGGVAGTLLGPRGTFVAAGGLSAVVGAALIVRIRRALGRSADAASAEPALEAAVKAGHP